jgi:hypothetical protein
MADDSNQILPGDKAGPTNGPGADKDDPVPGVRSAESIRLAKEEAETLEGQKAPEVERISVAAATPRGVSQANPPLLAASHDRGTPPFGVTARTRKRRGAGGLTDFARRQPVAFFAVATLAAFVVLRLITSSRLLGRR